MKPAQIDLRDVGATLEIETKVKSRPIRGVMREIEHRGGVTRVILEGAWGRKQHILTDKDEVHVSD